MTQHFFVSICVLTCTNGVCVCFFMPSVWQAAVSGHGQCHWEMCRGALTNASSTAQSKRWIYSSKQELKESSEYEAHFESKSLAFAVTYDKIFLSIWSKPFQNCFVGKCGKMRSSYVADLCTKRMGLRPWTMQKNAIGSSAVPGHCRRE